MVFINVFIISIVTMIIVLFIHNIHTYLHTYKTYIHSYIYTFIHTTIHTYMHAYIHKYIHIHIHTYISYLSRSYIILNFVSCMYLSLNNALTYAATTNSRLWRVMFTNVVRSIDEIYVICEEEEGT